jgi:hypothetical protein
MKLIHLISLQVPCTVPAARVLFCAKHREMTSSLYIMLDTISLREDLDPLWWQRTNYKNERRDSCETLSVSGRKR